jgi:hypothetical protein
MKCRKCGGPLTVNEPVQFCKNPSCELRGVAEWTPDVDKPPAPATGDTTTSRAREPTSRQDRVAYCLRVITDGRWHPRMPRVLAARWSCSEAAIRAYAAEARRSLRGNVSAEDREALRVDLSMRFWRLAARAEKAGNFPGAVAALREVARLGMLLEPTVSEAEKQPPTDLDWGAIVASKRADA